MGTEDTPKKVIVTTNIHLREDEMICSRCHGDRLAINGSDVSDFDGDEIATVELCPKCLGTGKVDWIENVVGKEKPEFDLHMISNRPPQHPSPGTVWEDSKTGNYHVATNKGWKVL